MDPRKIEKVNLDKDFKMSTDRLEQLRAGRETDKIPMNDEYWKAIKKHRNAYMRGDFNGN